MASPAVITQELSPIYASLLGLAEKFRTANPPNYKACIQCLRSILSFKLHPRLEARTNYQLGSILFKQTKNIDLAKRHLETAVSHIFLLCFKVNLSNYFLIFSVATEPECILLKEIEVFLVLVEW